MLSSAEIDGLRHIPVNDALDAMRDAGIPIHVTDRRIRHGLDAMIYCGNFSYAEAVEKMAALFPDAARAGSRAGLTSYKALLETVAARASEKGRRFDGIKKGSMRESIAMELVKWWKALQLERIDVNVSLPGELREAKKDRVVTSPDGSTRQGLWSYHGKGLDLPDLILDIPQLMAIQAQGVTGEMPVQIFFQAHWPEGRIGIMIDDAQKTDFPDRFPPSAKIATSDRGFQAFYLLDKKYEQKFYDDLMAALNAKCGDENVRVISHNSRIPGFYNQKMKKIDGSGLTPRAFVMEWTSDRPKRFEQLVELSHVRWLEIQNDKKERVRIKTAERKPNKAARSEPSEPVPGGTDETRAFMESLQECEVPDWLTETGLRARDFFAAKFSDHFSDGPDRSAVDAMVARILYASAATPDEVYSYFLENMTQTCERVPRVRADGTMHNAVRLAGDKEIDRQARRLAANLSPVGMISDSWRTRTAAINSTLMERETQTAQLYPNLIPVDSLEFMARTGVVEEDRESVGMRM